MSASVIKDTYTHPDDLNEHEVFEQAALGIPLEIQCFNMDLVNVTKTSTIRVYYKVDDTNYRIAQVLEWVPGGEAVVLQVQIYDIFDVDVKVTMQTTGGQSEGATRSIPYTFGYRSD